MQILALHINTVPKFFPDTKEKSFSEKRMLSLYSVGQK